VPGGGFDLCQRSATAEGSLKICRKIDELYDQAQYALERQEERCAPADAG